MAGTIVLVRDRRVWRDRGRRYEVLLDDRVVDRLGNGEELELVVDPGRHRLRLRIDWTGSETIAVDVPDGGEVRLRCGPSGNPKGLVDRHAWIDLTLG